MNKYRLVLTLAFKKDLKRVKKRGYNLKLLEEVTDALLKGEKLPEKNRDHELSGNWKGYRECHIQSDWLLIYQIFEDKLILSLTGTGTHSDLFDE